MKELRLKMPLKWVELSNRQLVYVSRLWMMGYPEEIFMVKAFLFLTGLRIIKNEELRIKNVKGGHYYRHKAFRKISIDTEMMTGMVERCRFLLTPDEVMPIRRIGLARPLHYRLYDASFEEYLMAENYYFAFTNAFTRRINPTAKDTNPTAKDTNEEYLDCLIACLYRKPWQKWDAEKIQARARAFRKVDPAVKNAVFMWYLGFRIYVPKRCKALFKGSSGSGSSSFNAREYINGMIHLLTGGDITRKDQLMKSACWDALDELEMRAKEAEKVNSKK